MSVIQNCGMRRKQNIDQWNEVLGDDFVWVKHSTGEHVGKNNWVNGS